MRDNEEKKGKVLSVRLTEEGYENLKEESQLHHMSMSGYLAQIAVHGKNGLTPELMVKIQRIVNVAYKAIKDYEPETAEFLEQEMHELWSELK
ncbi:MAG: hypothetical protein IJJ69_04800 [Oscillospiraceae bacterium]|nr:hypothetical protein [Oscillospiraceae bacterium]